MPPFPSHPFILLWNDSQPAKRSLVLASRHFLLSMRRRTFSMGRNVTMCTFLSTSIYGDEEQMMRAKTRFLAVGSEICSGCSTPRFLACHQGGGRRSHAPFTAPNCTLVSATACWLKEKWVYVCQSEGVWVHRELSAPRVDVRKLTGKVWILMYSGKHIDFACSLSKTFIHTR